MTSLLNIAGNIPVVEAGGQSLRFEDGDSAYLSWTPASAGNRKTWTYSFWTKRGSVSATQTYLYSKSGTYGDQLAITEKVAWTPLEATGAAYNMQTNAVLRDPSAWYHIVLSVDTTQSTASDRVKIYVNGVLQTLSTASYPAQNYDGEINKSQSHIIGYNTRNNSEYLDSYLANVCFIDGTALDPTSFGEYDGTLWKPKSDADITGNLTFGTNGFYLPFKQTTEAEGFSTVTYTGNGGTQSIEGVGFEPDLVWIKGRNNSGVPLLHDSVRGNNGSKYYYLISSETSAEAVQTDNDGVHSIDSNGFTVGYGNSNAWNQSGGNYVAWCWDAGSGSAVSNTDGSITSSVKANTAKGFSVVSYTGTGANATVGHGLSSAPEMIILKNRTSALGWPVYHSANGATKFMQLEITNAVQTASTVWQDTAPTSSVFSVGTSTYVNQSSSNFIAYCFHSVSGYSSIGSYSGTGATGNKITTGFKPAFVMVKSYDQTRNWIIWDNTRTPTNPADGHLHPNGSVAEQTGSDEIQFDSDGFTFLSGDADSNTSGFNYIYMAFADTRDATFFGDTSGNSNNWTPNALNNTDVVPDSPVTGGNFAVLNTIDKHASAAISEGNLEIGTNTNAWYHQARATMFVNSGKWYWEVYQVGTGSFWKIGIRDNDAALTSNTTSSTGFEYYAFDGKKHSSSGAATYSSETGSQGNVYGFALDMDAGTITLYVNGVSQGTMFSGLSGYYAPTCSMYNSTIMFNFGQDSSFAGNETPQGNTDDNGVGDFYYAPPSGYLALTTSNLPTPDITAPDDYFNTVLWTGNAADRSITGVGFQPDFTWVKNRSNAYHHGLFDNVRGANKVLKSSDTSAEVTYTEQLTSFDTDGFSLGDNSDSGNYVNISGHTYVAWNWLAGNGTVSNTDGSITSTVSANQTAKFSVVSYVGNFTAGATVGHGLSATPEMIIIKNRDGTQEWIIYHASKTSTGNLRFDNTAGTTSDKVTGTSSSTFTVAADNAVNSSSANHIAYCFAEVEGYSKVGSYTGNGSADGTFVHCGFRPAWVIMKRTDSTGNWFVYDNKRPEYNSPYYLLPNTSFGGDGTDNPIDFLSNGFKLKTAGGGTNVSSGTYIFIALAEAPFKSANAR